jgi:DNA gyrase subunit A
LVVTEYGYGKCTPIDDYPRHSRGGGGVITLKVTEKNGHVTAARIITEKDSDLVIISAGGVVIRMDTANIIRGGRATQGRLMMNLGEGDTVVAVATTNGKKVDDPNGYEEDGNGEEMLVENENEGEQDLNAVVGTEETALNDQTE